MHNRFRSIRFAAVLAVLLLCPFLKSSLAQAQESNSPSAQIDSLMHSAVRTRSISQVTLSPDGKRLAWTESRQLFVSPVDNLAKPLRITAATSPDKHCGDHDPVWSPDSSSLAFLSDCADPGGQADLYLTRLDSNPPQRITSL